MNSIDLNPEIISQSDNFIAWKVDEPDGETTYHLEINNLTVHFFVEEWEQFIEFKNLFINTEKDKTGELAQTEDYYLSCEKTENGDFVYSMEIIGATLYFFEDDWTEFKELVRNL